MRKKNNRPKIIWDYEPSEESELKLLQLFEFLMSHFDKDSTDIQDNAESQENTKELNKGGDSICQKE